MASPLVIAAIQRRCEPHVAHFSTSIRKTRFNRSASDGLVLGLERVEAEDGAHEDPADGAAEVRIQGEQVTQTPGKRDDPLAHGDIRKDVVHEVGGGLGHAASSTGGAEPSALAGEGNQEVGATAETVEAAEAMGEDSASEVGAELAFDVRRQAGTRGVRSDASEEGLEARQKDRV